MLKKIIFTLILSSLTYTSYAKWTKIGEIEGSGIGYVNFAKVKKVDGYLEVLLMITDDEISDNIEEPSSMIITSLVNCKEKLSRATKISSYSGLLGGGNLISEQIIEDETWSKIDKKSRISRNFLLVCDL